MRTSFKTLLGTGFVLTVAVLALNAIVSMVNVRRLAENNRRVLRTAEALRLMETTLSTLKDAETGQRGFVLTGQEEYLAPYAAAVASIGDERRQLETLLDEPEQQQRLASLSHWVDEKLRELRETVNLRREHGLEAASKVVLTGRGRRAMGEIRRLVHDMEVRERQLLANRTSESQDRLGRVLTTFAITSVVGLMLVGVLGLVALRHLGFRQRAEEVLREQLDRWQVTLASVGDAVIVTDPQGRVTFLNQVAASLCGRSSDDSVGRTLTEVFRIVNEETRLPVEDPTAKVLREGQTVGLANHTVLVSADGTERPIFDSAAPIRNGREQIAGVVLVFRDDSDRRQHERELEDANRRKDEFLAMLAHELRNPLGSIRAAVEMLDRSEAKGDLDWSKQVIRRQVEHLARLLDDLLDVARITRGRIDLRTERVDAASIVNHGVETVRPQLEARGHRLETVIAPGPLWLEADPVRLEQIIVNLLTNAIRFTPPGGQIRLSAERSGGKVVIRVADNGAGLAPEVIPQLFEVFAQGERSLARSEGGLGVGLTIVKKLVDLHGGEVSARSEGPGQGSEFVVRLPEAEAPLRVPPKPPLPTPAPPTREPSATSDRTHVLVVDDNKDLAVGLARLLRALGHQVEIAHDGPSAVEAAFHHRPDAILLDIGLPGMDGYEVARTLRESEATRDVLIIAISGYGQDEDRRRSREAGMNHHLTKPVEIGTIAGLIAQGV